MKSERHWTTRRGFIAAAGFGSLGLYVTWAAIGASPLPFVSGSPGEPADPAMAHAHGAGAMSPEEFVRRHAEFLARFRQPDGSVRPAAITEGAHDHASMPDEGAKSDMAGMEHSRHAGMGHVHATSPSDHDADRGAHAEPPVEVFFAASRFSFAPDNLMLEVGRRYRFHMMATDVAHGASIAFGRASRIVRLRPSTVATLDLTFLSTGRRLVYCTVYCGPGHEGMHGSITVI